MGNGGPEGAGEYTFAGSSTGRVVSPGGHRLPGLTAGDQINVSTKARLTGSSRL